MKPDKAWIAGTSEAATSYIKENRGIWIAHLVQYSENEYGFMAHIPCEWCDYCDAELEGHDGAHEYKNDPYLGRKLSYIKDRQAYALSIGLDENALLDKLDYHY